MRKKLFISAIGMIAIILVIIMGNQVIIRLFANFSQKLITEYHELHSFQELKVSLSKTMTYLHISDTKNDAEIHSGFVPALHESFSRMDSCKRVLTDVHKGEPWIDTKELFGNLHRFEKMWIDKVESTENLTAIIYLTISQIIERIDLMVYETLEEIEEFEHRNDRVVKHGSATILGFGIFLIIFLTFSGIRFIRNLTKPIDQLVGGMKRISSGEKQVEVIVDSDDEFLFLAESFNSMLEALNETTVSKDFFSKILNNLFGALVVTDEHGKISFINDTACRLLKCDLEDLLGKESVKLFNCKSTSPFTTGDPVNLESYAAHLRKMTEMKTTDGRLIPVYVTCTILKDKSDQQTGMVVVGHDLTEEKAHEEKLERIRKDRLIAINEAEENERIRIAKDLHDGLGQILTGISYSIQNLKPENDEESNLIEKIQIRIDHAIQEAKNISHNLAPAILRDFGLVSAIKNLVERTNQLNKTEVVFNSYDFDIRIDKRLEKALFRICQEALHNIIKHAEAESATIELFREYQQIAMVIEDNGKGFDPSDQSTDLAEGGIGLISMKERAYVFDGDLTIDSAKGRGTEIIV